MNEYVSSKLKIISLFSMIGVVLAHAYNISTKFSVGDINFESGYNLFVQNLFTNGIVRIVIPIFFSISGYLFFLKMKGTMNEFLIKYKKRAKTLFLPYMLWSLWGLLFYFILQLFPQSKNFFTTELIVNYSLEKFLKTLFLDPIPYQLWFVRDLIMLVIISPLIYWAVKYLRIIPIVCLFIIWLEIFEFNFIIFSTEAFLFFSLGAYFAIHRNNIFLKKRNQKYYWLFTFLWIFIVSLKTTIANSMDEQTLFLSLLHKFSLLIGTVAIWSLYDLIMANKEFPNKVIYRLSSFSFIIYAFHEPILTIIKKGIFYVTGASEVMSLINYFLSPLITVIISIILGAILQKRNPKFYWLITGGR